MSESKKGHGIEIILVAIVTGMFAADLCFLAPSILESCDYVQMWKPIWQFLRDAVREGTVPLWNPYIGLGRPFLADTQNAVFYPPLYLILLGEKAGVFLLTWLHCFIAVLGMRRLGAALQAGRGQSCFMALCFLATGALTARWMTGQLPYCWALCYTPWLFYCAVRTSEPWNSRRVAVYALLLAAQFLCGNPQVFWFSTIGQGAFILGRKARLPTRVVVGEVLRDVSQFGVALLWCAGLVAMVLLPFVELVHQGNRNAPSPALANFARLEWWYLGSLISPTCFLSQNVSAYWETNLFVGLPVVVLGVAGMCRVREPNVRGFLVMSVVALFLALGGNTPAFPFLYHWLPGYASLRFHAREAFLVVFALICAAGIWLSRPHPRLLAFWNRHVHFPVRILLVGLFLFQVVVLLQATQKIKTIYAFANIFRQSPHFPYQHTLVEQLQKAGLMGKSEPPPRVCMPSALAPANNAMMYRYSNFDADFSLFLRRDWDYLHRSVGLRPSELINTSISDLVYQRGPFPYPDLALSAGFDPTNGTLCILTNTSPRAFVVYATEVVPDYDAILSRIADGHDIHRSALLEQSLAITNDNNQSATPAHIRRYEPDSLVVDVDARTNGLLVLAEAWYPGWWASVDNGWEHECVPANLWMRAVPVPAGQHQVRFYFHQNYLLAGLLVSAVSACLLLSVLLWPIMCRKQ